MAGHEAVKDNRSVLSGPSYRWAKSKWELEMTLAVSQSADESLRVLHVLSSSSGGTGGAEDERGEEEDDGPWPATVDSVRGRFDRELLSRRPDCLPKPSEEARDDTMIVICGPWDFARHARAVLQSAGFSSRSLFRVP